MRGKASAAHTRAVERGRMRVIDDTTRNSRLDEGMTPWGCKTFRRGGSDALKPWRGQWAIGGVDWPNLRSSSVSTANLPGPKRRMSDRRDQEGVGRGGVELVGIGEDREERLAVGGDVGHDHVDREDECGEAREQTDRERDAAEEFEAGDGERGLRGHRQAEAGEKFGDVRKMMELAPAALDELPAPVEADEEQEWGLKIRDEREEAVVEAAETRDEVIHS